MPALSPSCTHTHPNGLRCGSPALRGELFCFFHHPTRRPPTRVRPAHTSFYLPPILDAETAQFALCEIIRRLAENTISTQRANLLFNLIQAVKPNLGPSIRRTTGPDSPDLAELLSRIVPPPTPAASRF